MEIAVGDSVALEVTFSTKHFSGPQPQRQQIETNGTDSPHEVLLTANMARAVDTTYPLVVTGWPVVATGPIGSVGTEYSFEITNTSPRSLDLTIIDSASEYFTVDIPPHLEPNQTATCDVSIHDWILDQKFKKSITIEVSDSAHTRFTIPVRRYIPE